MFENVELGRTVDKEAFEARVPDLREELLDLQFRLRTAPLSVAIVIAGVEGSGKGDTVNELCGWLDARRITAHALGSPSEEERERPEFFRFWRRLPPHGHMAIYFGSWYTRPILARTSGELVGAELDAAARRIVDFERMLSDENVLLLKFWLHISKEQQKQHFEELEADEDTAWRVTPRDWELHRQYDEFQDAAARMLQQSDSGFAPWTLVEAWDRRHRVQAIAEEIRERLSARLDLPPRDPSPPAPLPVPDPVNVIRALDLSSHLPRDEYKARKASAQARIGRRARELTQAQQSFAIVFEGPDAAGKGGCIRRLTQALDARFCRVWPIAAPTSEELAQPYLWRFWRRLPRFGRIAIFDRSWYGRVLVERIEGLAEPDDWQRAYSEINAFEEQLTDGSCTVLKFWLAISPDEQLRRFEAREATGYKRYKITDEDWRNREHWDAYEAAACEMIRRTSTRAAPWTLVPAEDKRFARVTVLEAVAERLERSLEST